MPAAMTGMDRENGTFRFEPMRAFAVNMNQIQTAPTGRTPLGSDRDTYLQPVLRDRGNKTATERCKNPATKRTKPQAGRPTSPREWAKITARVEQKRADETRGRRRRLASQAVSNSPRKAKLSQCVLRACVRAEYKPP